MFFLNCDFCHFKNYTNYNPNIKNYPLGFSTILDNSTLQKHVQHGLWEKKKLISKQVFLLQYEKVSIVSIVTFITTSNEIAKLLTSMPETLLIFFKN